LHTHRHQFPTDLNIAKKEIDENRRFLEAIAPFQLDQFCYPSGFYDPSQWSLLTTLGVKSSTTCIPGNNSELTPRHGLRRFLDGSNVHQLEFEAEISGFSDLLRQLKGNESR
jgi:hypothetical protein